MNVEATISADIVNSTSLTQEELIRLRDHLISFIDLIEEKLHLGWGRIVRGDGIECVVTRQQNALRLALLLKAYIKMFEVMSPTRRFKQTGVRIAIGIGGLRVSDRYKGIIDGESIYNSGRALSRKSRNSFVIISTSRENKRALHTISTLLGLLLDRATVKQSHVLFMRLQGLSDREIAGRLSVSPIAVWGHLNKVGWRGIEEALEYFEQCDLVKGRV